MKKIVTSILGVSLLAGAVYAAGSHKMGNMNGMHAKNAHTWTLIS